MASCPINPIEGILRPHPFYEDARGPLLLTRADSQVISPCRDDVPRKTKSRVSYLKNSVSCQRWCLWLGASLATVCSSAQNTTLQVAEAKDKKKKKKKKKSASNLHLVC
ncbi:hypothetical protein CEXT_522641 [Caerostris extrusa]|uniref:Uncharacterized protein n=1 Tax=Caerostris extrusa TaxID=172846 RepID=A0AAV4MPY5_CAEEX|nr:hypothetical protein CEXT_522641 [Caerostris extrusa]